jgi:hypothetical protein
VVPPRLATERVLAPFTIRCLALEDALDDGARLVRSIHDGSSNSKRLLGMPQSGVATDLIGPLQRLYHEVVTRLVEDLP